MHTGRRHSASSILWVSLFGTLACAKPIHDAGPPPAPTPVSPATLARAVPVQLPAFPDRRFVVTEHGATGDGTTNDTPGINHAIDACNAAGGGTVYFPPGTYMAASVHLKSHVRLQLDAGATLKALPTGYDPPEPNAFEAYQDFGHDHFHNALLWGEHLTDVAIEGPGAIDGRSLTTGDPKGNGGDKQVALVSSERILFRDLHQVGGGHFFYLLTDCKHVTLANLDMQKGRDGIDLVGCSHVDLHHLKIMACGDDTIALKSDYSLGRRLHTENVRAWDSTVESGCNGLQFGSETAGDFKDIHFWNIDVLRGGKAGIGLQTNDGGTIEDVTFDDIRIKRAANPIFINTTARLRTPEKVQPGRVRHVRIRNVVVTEVVETHKGEPANAATISGLPGIEHEDIVLENVSITYGGGGTRADGEAEPGHSNTNYNPRALGPRPAYGFFVRYAKDVVFRNVKVGFQNADQRPAWAIVNVDGLTLDGIDAQKAGDDAWPSVRLKEVSRFTLRNASHLPSVQESKVAAGGY
jgi:polygalacturonase